MGPVTLDFQDSEADEAASRFIHDATEDEIEEARQEWERRKLLPASYKVNRNDG